MAPGNVIGDSDQTAASAGANTLVLAPLFKTLGDAELATLSGHAETRIYQPGECVIEEGDTGEQIFLIVRGSARVQVRVPAKTEPEVLGERREGEFIGEMVLLGLFRRSATVIAAQRLEVLVWQAKNLEALFESHSRLGYVIMRNFATTLSDRLALQSKALTEMSTPVTQLWPGILFVPLVGVVDANRARAVMSVALAKAAETQARAFIIDISGVAVVDALVADHLVRIGKAMGLMGCECTISGVSPEVAKTLVALDVDTAVLSMTAAMHDALKGAFAVLGDRTSKVTPRTRSRTGRRGSSAGGKSLR